MSIKSIGLSCLTVGVLTGAACAQAVAEDNPPVLDDRKITIAIETELWTDEAVDGNAVEVTCREGVVTLQGTVSNLLARDRAERIAEAVVGVQAIINRVDVNTTVTGSDADLRDAVVAELFRDPATDAYEVNVLAEDGVVTLVGTVDSWQERELCSSVVRSVFGVREVRNQLDLKHAVTRLDSEIEPEVEARLRNDVRVDDNLVEVHVVDGQVSLTGIVGSLAEKRRAIRDAWVGGVSSVDGSGLEVRWWARDQLRRVRRELSDAQIEAAVRKSFSYDPRVVGLETEVDVQSGTVTLRGTVTNLEAKMAAEDDARNVVGVNRVRNHLRVRPAEAVSNEELERRVERALMLDPHVERYDVSFDAREGWVFLSGSVDTSFEKRQAGAAVQGVKGVTRVTNNIDYQRVWLPRPDFEIVEDVEAQLFWSPFVDEQRVDVEVEDGIVTLSGIVSDWGERLAAEQNAWQGGAKDVRTRLRVEHTYAGSPERGGIRRAREIY